jgi:hypothetical protein
MNILGWVANQNYDMHITIYHNHTGLYNDYIIVASHLYIILISYTMKLSYRKRYLKSEKKNEIYIYINIYIYIYKYLYIYTHT